MAEQFEGLFDNLPDLHARCFFRPQEVNGQLYKEEVNALAAYGVSPLHMAGISPMPFAARAVSALLQAEADPDAVASDGATPLLWAVRWGTIDTVIAFGEDRIILESTDSNGRNAAHWWAMGPAGSGEEINDLLNERQVSFDATDRHGWAPVHWAVAVGGRFGPLLDSWPELAHQPDESGFPPIFHSAAGGAGHEALARLLEAGADPGHRAGQLTPEDVAASPDAWRAATGQEEPAAEMEGR